MLRNAINAPEAAQILAENLGHLQHPDAGLLRLVQFSHQSDGVRTLAGQIGEALVMLLEGRGWTLVPPPGENLAGEGSQEGSGGVPWGVPAESLAGIPAANLAASGDA
jgi:hypothetical protein